MSINWQDKSTLDIETIDRRLSASLFQTGSLSRYLQAECCGAFRVQPEAETWQRPLPDEAARLSQSAAETAFIRAAWLKSGAQRLVYARTVIPKTTLAQTGDRLTRLGARPLGEVLFTEGARRSPLRYARLPPGTALGRLLQDQGQAMTEALWARQSLFHLQDAPLLITEVFLPELTACLQT